MRWHCLEQKGLVADESISRPQLGHRGSVTPQAYHRVAAGAQVPCARFDLPALLADQ